MANNSGQEYFFNALRRGAQPLTRAAGGWFAPTPNAAPPVGIAPPVPPRAKLGAPPQLSPNAGPEINEEVTAAEVVHERTTFVSEQSDDAPSLADEHPVDADSAAAPLQLHARADAEIASAQSFALQARQPVDARDGPDHVAPTMSGEQAVEVALTAHAPSAPAVVMSADSREPELSLLLAGESVGNEHAGGEGGERRPPPQAGWRADETFTFDARRPKQTAKEGAAGEDEESPITIFRRPRARHNRVAETPESDPTPTIRLPRPAYRMEPESPVMPAHRASTDDAARAEMTTTVEPDRNVRHMPEQMRAHEPAGADWARELARELAANTSPRPQPASEQLVLAAPPPAYAQPRAEAPKLTIHRLDVQVINQPPAPPIQFMPPPAEAEPSAGAVDLDRHYLGRISFMI